MNRLILVMALGLMAACGASEPQASAPRRGVLVIAFDCLRADRMSLHGYDRETTPFLDSLASEGLVFEQHYAATPDRLPSHTSILTGCDPRMAIRPALAGVDQKSLFIEKSAPRLARAFLERGYRTAAFSDSLGFSERHGFNAGFEEFQSYRPGASQEQFRFGIPGVSQRFRRWLRGLGEDESWFAYMQLQDLERIWQQEDPTNDKHFAPRPELEFVPPLSSKRESFFAVPSYRWNGGATTLGELEARYEGNLRECDQSIGRLVAWLKQRGFWETTTLVVTGSYGVGFGEQGLYLTTGALSEGDLNVPWFVRPAPSLDLPTGQRLAQLTSAIDIAPTLLDLSGLGVPAGMHGISHLDAIRGERANLRERAYAAGGVFGGFAVVTKDDHFTRLSADSLNPKSLYRSYFGEEPPAGRREHTYVDELREVGTGRLLELSEERATQERNAGLQWFRWVRKSIRANKAAPK